MLTGDEPITEMSAIIVTKGAGSDFESASQVGSHASFPQWEVGTEVGEFSYLSVHAQHFEACLLTIAFSPACTFTHMTHSVLS